MTYETLDIHQDGRGVAYVTLNLPDKRNALSARMIDELTDMAQTLGAARDTRAIVLSGAGKVFCAGGDLDAAVEAEVAPYLSVAPGAVGAAKALVLALGPRIDAQVIDDTIRQLADIWEGSEATDGIEAFFAKTPAPWAKG